MLFECLVERVVTQVARIRVDARDQAEAERIAMGHVQSGAADWDYDTTVMDPHHTTTTELPLERVR